MPDLFLAPGAPFYTMALAGGLFSLLGLTIGGQRLSRRSFIFSNAPLTATGRLLAGQLAGLSLAALLLGVAMGSGVRGSQANLLVCAALAAYLALGFVLPRLPQLRHERQAAALRRLTPGFISFVRVALGSFEAPIEIMRRYTRRPHPRLAVMQTLVSDALETGADQRLRPFAALSLTARDRGCRELCDVADALAQAEAEGARVETVLAAHQETLELILQGEFKRMIRRRTMYLLLMVAISLVVGILANLLFVMTAGGSLFSSI
ncbi:MAG: hypothetical protein EOM24_01650 [Chloroflexia bacterium]|nr:hypothetical protein [Chloroflexia bacterium]